MAKLMRSVAFRLALFCGGLVVATVVLLSAVFYFGTIGVLRHGTDASIRDHAYHFTEDGESRGLESLSRRIEQTLADGVDSDTEIYLLTDAGGRMLAGNLTPWTDGAAPMDQLIDHPVTRNGRTAAGRLMLHRLSGGGLLVVGRDMSDLNAIVVLTWRAIAVGGLLAFALALLGTLLFRQQIEGRIGAIRHAALDIEAGNLSRRIPLSGEDDEFDRLSHDINRMLDRIEHLMDGVRHVSNTIAHNLRTPLGRIRGHLDEALQGRPDMARLTEAGEFAIEEVDALIVALNKLLQIAEAESGSRRQPFALVDLGQVVAKLVDLYEAAAEDQQITLAADLQPAPAILGDSDLLASGLANLLDNAFKYSGRRTTVIVRVGQEAENVILTVQDDGPGIPEAERSKVLQRFYRLDRNQQGHGLGLSIVAAITSLHGGTLTLEDAAPGLRVRIVLPRA
ncbi:MAG: HAMP domain-containing sensor histidine kinase [Rhodocyclaceae bacterium]|nr:HAMP domain-containing sensor histidine kinase [Rhodocyclaceae bacterium]